MLFVLILLLIQMILILLKVVGVISWDWDTVFIPIYSLTVMFAVGLTLAVVLFLLCQISIFFMLLI